MTKGNWMTVGVALAAVLAIGLLAVGCDNDSHHGGMGGMHHQQSADSSAKVAVVNSTCPMMGGKVDAKVAPGMTRQYKNQTIGFCCAGCPQQWDKLTDAQKDAKLAEILKK